MLESTSYDSLSLGRFFVSDKKLQARLIGDSSRVNECNGDVTPTVSAALLALSLGCIWSFCSLREKFLGDLGQELLIGGTSEQFEAAIQ